MGLVEKDAPAHQKSRRLFRAKATLTLPDRSLRPAQGVGARHARMPCILRVAPLPRAAPLIRPQESGLIGGSDSGSEKADLHRF